MIIKISNFKKWTGEHEFEFPEFKITLIEGQSGKGKTSIIKAIQWCLYKKGDKVTPKGKPASTRTSVKFISDNLIIRRRNNSAKLSLSCSDYDTKLYGDEAQAIINEKFGDLTKWMTASYIGQKEKERNFFVQAKQKDRKEILYNLAPSLDNDSKLAISCLEDIEVNISDAKSKHKEKEGLYVELETTYNDLLEKAELKLYKDAQPEDHNKIEKEIKSIIIAKEKEIKNMCQHLIKVESITKEVEKAKLTKDSLEKEKKALKTPNTICTPSDDVRYLSQIADKLNQVANLEKKIGPNNDMSKITVYTEEQYQAIYSEEKEYEIGRKLATRLDIEYKEEVINELRNDYNSNLHLFDKYEHVPSIKKPIFESVIPKEPVKPTHEMIDKPVIEKLVKPDTNDLEKRIQQIQLYLALLKCPHCDGRVRISGGKLIKEVDLRETNHELEDEIVNLETKIESLNKEYKKKKDDNSKKLNEYDSRVAIWNKYNNDVEVYQERVKTYNLKKIEYERQLDNYNSVADKIKKMKVVGEQLEEIYGTTNKTDVLGCLDILNKIVFVPKPTKSSENVKKQMSTYKLYQEMLQIKSTIDTKYIGCTSKEIERMISAIETYKKEDNRINTSLSIAEKRLQTLKTQLEDLKSSFNCKDTLENLESTLKLYQEEKENLAKCITVNKLYQRLVKLDAELIKLEEQIAVDTRFKDKVIIAQHKLLDDLVNQINQIFNSIAMMLFNDTFIIQLSLNRELKSRKCIKTEIGFRVSNNGAEYDIKELSGGEEDRVSFAFTLALSLLSKCPLLIFDESLKFLDDTYRELALKTLRTFATNKTIIMINHEGVTGYYDNLITL